jgi:diguanylate cyclase (GGDEF)-like protein
LQTAVPPLDLFTVRVMTLITVVMSSMATIFAWRTNRSVEGMRWFALGLVSMSFGSVLGLAAAVLDSYVSMIAGWIFRFGGMILVGQSIRVFRGFPVWPPGLTVTFAAFVPILFSYWVWGHESSELRIGVISSALSVIAADASISMFRRVAPRDRLTHWSTGVVFAFVAIYLAARGIAKFSGSSRAGSLSPVAVETIATICANVAFIGCAFGMLLASNARLTHAAERGALFDPLTNLPNRRFFEDQLLQAEQRARVSGRQVGIVYIDLDKFKLVNDTRGHQAGDDLLRSVSAAMAGVLRLSDCLARVGGDEFVVLVEDIEHRRQLDRLAERLSAAIEGMSDVESGRMTHASYGVAVFPDDGSSIQDVMRQADADMYQAKRRYRRAPESSKLA